jgi:hypothetical protein
MNTFFARNVALLLGIGVLVALAAVYVSTSTSNDQTLTEQQQQISDLEAQLAADSDEVRVAQQVIFDEVMGSSQARIDSDTEALQSFVNRVANWDSGESYEEARTSVIRKYALDENAQFMRDFFTEPVYNTDPSGKRYYVIDTDRLNSSLGQMDARVLSVSGTEYRYMVLADFTSVSNDGGTSSSQTSTIFVTVDGEGVLSDVTGYTSVEGAKSSN